MIDLTKVLDEAPNERIMDLLSAVMNAPQAYEIAEGEWLFLEFDVNQSPNGWVLYATDDDGNRIYDWDAFLTADRAREAVEALREAHRKGWA